MERKLVLAIGLSLLVLLSWSALMRQFYPVENKSVTLKQTTPLPVAPPAAAAPALAKADTSATHKIAAGKLEIIFLEPQAAIKEIIFLGREKYRFWLGQAFMLLESENTFKRVALYPESGRNVQSENKINGSKNVQSENKINGSKNVQSEIKFVQSEINKEIIKDFTVSNNGYTIGLQLNVRNMSNLPLTFRIPLQVAMVDFDPKNPNARYQDIAIASAGNIMHRSAQKEASYPEIKFLALREQYFCLLVQPENSGYTAMVKRIDSQHSEISLLSEEITLPAGGQIGHFYRIYCGPQDAKMLGAINPTWQAVVHYGAFDIIAQILLAILGFFFKLTHNWGVAIILLSVAVYLLLFPLSLKQMRSMKEMQVLQPKVEELRRAYKDNPQKFNKEVMQLYREHKVNPLGGCLPLLLQMPIFFALYQVLSRLAVLKGAPFFWIKDLAQPDKLMILPVSLPILGNELNLLPIVMAIGMFLQQRFSSAGAAAGSSEQQKMMLIIMPIMFGVIFYRMPSGLVLYWLVNSILMLISQLRMQRQA